MAIANIVASMAIALIEKGVLTSEDIRTAATRLECEVPGETPFTRDWLIQYAESIEQKRMQRGDTLNNEAAQRANVMIARLVQWANVLDVQVGATTHDPAEPMAHGIERDIDSIVQAAPSRPPTNIKLSLSE